MSRKTWFGSQVLLVALAGSTLAGCLGSSSPPPMDFDVYQQFAKEREFAYAGAHYLGAKYHAGDDPYMTGQTLYTNAKAEHNSLLGSMEQYIATDNTPPPDKVKPAVERAFAASGRFNQHVARFQGVDQRNPPTLGPPAASSSSSSSSGSSGSSGSSASAAIPWAEMIKLTFDGCQKMAADARAQRDADRKAMCDRLTNLRWKEFDEVVAKPASGH